MLQLLSDKLSQAGTCLVIFAFVIDFLALLNNASPTRIAFQYGAMALGRRRPLLLIEIISGLPEYLSGFAQIVRS
jgi:hypothetical protein